MSLRFLAIRPYKNTLLSVTECFVYGGKIHELDLLLVTTMTTTMTDFSLLAGSPSFSFRPMLRRPSFSSSSSAHTS